MEIEDLEFEAILSENRLINRIYWYLLSGQDGFPHPWANASLGKGVPVLFSRKCAQMMHCFSVPPKGQSI